MQHPGTFTNDLICGDFWTVILENVEWLLYYEKSRAKIDTPKDDIEIHIDRILF